MIAPVDGLADDRGRRPPALLVAAALVAPVLVLLPIVTTVFGATRIGFSEASAILFRPLVGSLLVNSVLLVIATTVSSALIGTATAWCVERTRLTGRRLWGSLAALPLAIPAFVTSYAWISVSPLLQDFGGAVLVVTCSYYPLVYLPVAAALRGLDPVLEETGRALGLGPWHTFFRIVLPQLRPALVGGMLLVALNTLTEFGAFALLRFRTFTTEIYAVYRTSFDGAEASLLATVLLALCLLCLVAEARVRGSGRYARLGPGARRAAPPVGLAHAQAPVLAGFILLSTVTVGVPLGTLAFWTMHHSTDAITPAQASMARVGAATASTIGFGFVGAFVTTALALPITFLSTRYGNRKIVMLADRSTFLAQGVPGIVVALALVALVIHHLPPLYQSSGLLIIAYAILFLPLAVVAIRATLVQMPQQLEEAARALGLGALAVAWRVILPSVAPGIGAAAVLVFVSVTTELTATLLLAPIGTRTLATEVWSDTSALAFAAAAPYAATMTAISLAAALLLAGRFGHSVAPASL